MQPVFGIVICAVNAVLFQVMSVAETNECSHISGGLIALGIVVAVMAIVIIIMAIAIYRLRSDRQKQTSQTSGPWLMSNLQSSDICRKTDPTLVFLCNNEA